MKKYKFILPKCPILSGLINTINLSGVEYTHAQVGVGRLTPSMFIELLIYFGTPNSESTVPFGAMKYRAQKGFGHCRNVLNSLKYDGSFLCGIFEEPSPLGRLKLHKVVVDEDCTVYSETEAPPNAWKRHVVHSDDPILRIMNFSVGDRIGDDCPIELAVKIRQALNVIGMANPHSKVSEFIGDGFDEYCIEDKDAESTLQVYLKRAR